VRELLITELYFRNQYTNTTFLVWFCRRGLAVLALLPQIHFKSVGDDRDVIMRNLRFVWLYLYIVCASSIVGAQGASHKAMLASIYPGNAPVTEYWVSEKLDGVRGHWDGEALWTRSGYLIKAPAWFTQHWPAMTMDGELWIARGSFDVTSTIVRSSGTDDAEWHQIQFMVFDLPGHGGVFGERVQVMGDIAAHAIPWLRAIKQFKVRSTDELDLALEALVADGGEGLMLHHQNARYLSGRSQDLVKYKLYEDAEARVLGYTAGNGKYTGKIGALDVESADGRRFRLGSGLSDADRTQPPPVGSWVTYRFNGLTSSGLPRFARFLRTRKAPPTSPILN
jgi:DNA ligase-1